MEQGCNAVSPAGFRGKGTQWLEVEEKKKKKREKGQWPTARLGPSTTAEKRGALKHTHTHFRLILLCFGHE